MSGKHDWVCEFCREPECGKNVYLLPCTKEPGHFLNEDQISNRLTIQDLFGWAARGIKPGLNIKHHKQIPI